MEGKVATEELQNPNNGGHENPTKKPKIIVIMGPTGSGKSRLAVDLADHFPIEIINADSMQVYRGLDVLTNKVTIHEQKGVKHHLLGTINPNVEFTSKDFRDAAIPLIQDILSRNHLPVIVGGTNFYIQALVSPFLLDDSVEDMDGSCLSDRSVNQQEHEFDLGDGSSNYSYDCLRAIDPVAANRIHPNDHRKIKKYLELFAQSGIPASKLYQEKMTEKWGCVGDNSRYDSCFICVDASLPVLDQFIEQRVDKMLEAGLLDEVYDIYTLNADYTRGLRQAIGVREFEDFLHALVYEAKKERCSSEGSASQFDANDSLRQNMRKAVSFSTNIRNKCLLEEAIEKLKANTRKLVRRQKRRISRLHALFGWNIHYVDSTESLHGDSSGLCDESSSENTWISQVVEPAAKVISSFLNSDEIPKSVSNGGENGVVQKLNDRDLWTQYICEACGHRVLRGAYEWEQHKQGRGHRKRVAKLRKHQGSILINQQRSEAEQVTT